MTDIHSEREWYLCSITEERYCAEICESNCRASQRKRKECKHWQAIQNQKQIEAKSISSGSELSLAAIPTVGV